MIILAATWFLRAVQFPFLLLGVLLSIPVQAFARGLGCGETFYWDVVFLFAPPERMELYAIDKEQPKSDFENHGSE